MHDGDDNDSDSGIAQHVGHTSANRLTETCSLGLKRPSDMGHPCDGQLMLVKTKQGIL